MRATLRADSRFIDAGNELHCDGSAAPLANIYPVEVPHTDWEGWDFSDAQMPDPKGMSTLVFECRSTAWVAEVGRLLAGSLSTPVWFVDAADNSWPADQVDPHRVALA